MEANHTDCWGGKPRKNYGSHIDASHSRQPLVKGERLVRYEVNAVMIHNGVGSWYVIVQFLHAQNNVIAGLRTRRSSDENQRQWQGQVYCKL